MLHCGSASTPLSYKLLLAAPLLAIATSGGIPTLVMPPVLAISTRGIASFASTGDMNVVEPLVPLDASAVARLLIARLPNNPIDLDL